MKDAVGGSSLLNIVVIFTSLVILFFAGIMAYSKAYKIKNRIIEVIEKHEKYDDDVEPELEEDLRRAGYIVATSAQVAAKCTDGQNLNTSEYLYCIYEKCEEEECDENGICVCSGQRLYKVTTFIHFDFPIIGDRLTFAVKGETKMLGKVYDY